MAESIDIELKVKTDTALAELKKLPGITDREAKAMAAALNKSWRQAEKDSQRAARQMAKDFEKGIDSIKGSAEKLAGMIGGPVGDVADLALDLGEKMSNTAGAIGAAGAAAGVTAAAVAAVGVSFVSLSNAAIAARDRLEEAGLAAELPDAALQSLADYEAATSDLSVAMDRFTVLVGAQTAEALAGMVALLAKGVEAMASISVAATTAGTALNTVAETSQYMARTMTAVVSLNLSETLLGMADSAQEAAVGGVSAADAYAALGIVTEDAEADAAALANRLQEQADAERRAAEETRRAAAAQRDKAKADQEAEEAAAKFLQEVEAIIAARKEDRAEAAAQAADQAKVVDWYQKTETTLADVRVQMDELADSMAGLSATNFVTPWQQASDAVQAYAAATNEVVNSPAADAVMSGLSDVAELQSFLYEQDLAQLQDRIARREEEIGAWKEGELSKLEAQVESGEVSKKDAMLRRQEIAQEAADKKKALNERLADEKAAILKSFRAGQQLQRGLAIVDAARAALALIPAFAFLGPLAPAGAAAVVAPALALQLATIKAQKPPEFPMGRQPLSSDHTQLAALQPTEAVLTSRGVQAAGGAEGVAALNDARVSSRPIVVQLDRRVLAEAMMVSGMARPVDPRLGKADPWRSA